jgi:hypothetical protein
MYRHTHTRGANYDQRSRWYWVRQIHYNGGRSNFYTYDIDDVNTLQNVGKGRGNLNVLKSDKPADRKEKDKEEEEGNDAKPEVPLVTHRQLKF